MDDVAEGGLEVRGIESIALWVPSLLSIFRIDWIYALQGIK